MWWYVLQGGIIAAVLLSDIINHWTNGKPGYAFIIGIVAAAFVSALIDEPLGFFRWIRAKFVGVPRTGKPPQQQ